MRSSIKRALDTHKRRIYAGGHAIYGSPRLFRPFDGKACRWAINKFAMGCCITAIHKSGQRADDLSLHSPTSLAALRTQSKKPNLVGWAKCLNLLVLMRRIERPTY
jgi:hypothetical protein